MSFFRTVAPLVFLVGLPACSDDPLVPQPEAVGRYSLVQFETVPVPGVLSQVGPVTFEILYGEFLIEADGTCSGIWRFRMVDEGGANDSEVLWNCTWTDGGNVISFKGDLFPTGTGSLLDDRLTVLYLTGVVCFTTPCPTRHTAVYERVG